jgi:outer membrane protein, multidrug efflux system
MRKLSAFCIALALGGCFKVGPDYQKPQIDTPQQWRFADDRQAQDLSNSLWWQQMGDPVLNRLVQQALQNNLDLKAAVANIEKFVGQYGSTRSSLFPQLSGNASYDRAQASHYMIQNFNLSGPDTDFAHLEAQMNWELDIWGALRRANEAAKADLLAQEAVRRGVVLSLVSKVVQTYIQLRTLDRNLEITREVVTALQEDLRIREKRFQQGYTSKLEVDQARSELQRRNALIPQYEQTIAETEHGLCVLLALNPGPIERGLALDKIQPPAIPAGLPSDLLTRRPDIAQAEQALIGATARIGVAKGQYFPRIALTGGIGQISSQMAELMTPGANFWSVGSSLAAPIFTSGKIAGQVQSAEAAEQAALASYQQTVINALREFENALVSTRKTREQREQQNLRVGTVQQYFHLSKLRYDEGYTDYITVLDAIRQLYEAQTDLIGAQNAHVTASIDLYRAMGGGWITQGTELSDSPKIPEAAYFP